MSIKAWLFAFACTGVALLTSCGNKNKDEGSETKDATYTYSDGTTLKCSGDQILYQDGYCRSPQNYPNQSGSWRCPQGTVLYSDGLCRAPQSANANGADARGKYCPPGTILYSDGLCRKPQTTGGISCPYGTVLYTDGTCR